MSKYGDCVCVCVWPELRKLFADEGNFWGVSWYESFFLAIPSLPPIWGAVKRISLVYLGLRVSFSAGLWARIFGNEIYRYRSPRALSLISLRAGVQKGGGGRKGFARVRISMSWGLPLCCGAYFSPLPHHLSVLEYLSFIWDPSSVGSSPWPGVGRGLMCWAAVLPWRLEAACFVGILHVAWNPRARHHSRWPGFLRRSPWPPRLFSKRYVPGRSP